MYLCNCFTDDENSNEQNLPEPPQEEQKLSKPLPCECAPNDCLVHKLNKRRSENVTALSLNLGDGSKPATLNAYVTMIHFTFPCCKFRS